MEPMAGMAGMAPVSYAALALMWAVMMAAMMLPASAPLLLLYARARQDHRGVPQSAVVLLGYLLVWALFGLIAAAVQHRWLAGADLLADRRAQAALLAAAGIYQFTALKRACLGRCRSPAAFLARHFRPGLIGAVRLGILHGITCVGCCWLLMLLLFVGGVMNLAWVALLTLLVSAEKLIPGGERVARLAGAALVGWAVLRLVA